MPYALEREQWVPRPVEEVFGFFSEAANLEALTPAWLRFEVLTQEPIKMTAGILIDYRLHWHGIQLLWKTEIIRWEPLDAFEDLQIKGPYKLWHHTHRFQAVAGGTRIIDSARYALPLGILGRVMHAICVRRNIEEIFDFRDAKVQAIFGDDKPSRIGGR